MVGVEWGKVICKCGLMAVLGVVSSVYGKSRCCLGGRVF